MANVLRSGLPDGSGEKNLPVHAGDVRGMGSIPGSGRSGRGSLLQYPCLENPMDRGAWWATVHGVTQSRTRPESDFPSCIVFKDSDHIPIASISRKCSRERSQRPCGPRR